MATLNVCSTITQKIERFQVTVGSFDSTVESLEKEIRNKLDSQKSSFADFDIIYCGKVLMPLNQLSNYMLQSHSTVFVVKKFTSCSETESKSPQHPEGATSAPVNKAEVLVAMQSALKCVDYRSIAEHIVTDPVMVESLIAASPGLDQDPAVLAMLQQPELLAVLLHKNSFDSLLQKHPAFGPAAIKVASVVKEEAAKRGTAARTTENLTYSLDQMSDEEEDAPRSQQMRGAAGGSNITTSQLAAAIQAVTGTGSMAGAAPFSSAPSTSQGAPGPSGSSSSITSDFFQQAMAHAQTASSDSALQQLREMGITDENVARQALAATGGDIQAAIDLIFGDGMM